MQPNITFLKAENLSLTFDPSAPVPVVTLPQLRVVRVNVAPSRIAFLAHFPATALPKLSAVSLTGKFFKRDFMGPPFDDEEDFEGFGLTHDGVAAFMSVFSAQLRLIDAASLIQITTSDIRSLQRCVPGAEAEWDDDTGLEVEDSAEWEWDQRKRSLVRV